MSGRVPPLLLEIVMLAARCFVAVTLLGMLSAAAVAQEDAPVFSGPQEGEKLADFKILEVLKNEGKSFQFHDKVGKDPVLLIFVHKVTRPSIGLLRTVIQEASEIKVKTGLVFLTDDVTAMQQQVGRMSRALPKSAFMGISSDKQEGPGAYGLNRNMTLTVLVGKDGKVVANYALVQPSVQADAIKVIRSTYKAAGKKDPPKLAAVMLRRVNNEELRKPLLALLDIEAKDRDPAKLIKQIDDIIAKQPRVKTQLAGISGQLRMVIQDEKIEDSVRAAMQRWSRRPGNAVGRDRMSAKLTGLIRAVIQKDASEEEVIAANQALEDHLKENASDRAEVARIATTISNSGKLENYGTAKAQEFIKAWAKKYGGQRRTPKR